MPSTWEQCINSIGRAFLNEDLLREALSLPGIRVFFQHKVIAVDFDHKNMTVHDIEGGKDVNVFFDLCIGADGSYSIVRRQLTRVVRCVYPIDPSMFSAFSRASSGHADQTRISPPPTGWTTSRNISRTNISSSRCLRVRQRNLQAILPFCLIRTTCTYGPGTPSCLLHYPIRFSRVSLLLLPCPMADSRNARVGQDVHLHALCAHHGIRTPRL